MRPLHRLLWPALLAAFFCGPALKAQSTTVQNMAVSVTATQKGATFWVDGAEVKTAGTFFWPVGSKHTLEVRSLVQIYGDGRSRLVFTSFSAGAATLPAPSSPVQLINVDSSTPAFTINFNVEHRVAVYVDFDPLRNLLDPSTAEWAPLTLDMLPASASRNGFVVAGSAAACGGGVGVPTSTWFWQPAGTQLNAAAYPYPGKVFTGFQTPPGPSGNMGIVTITQPTELRARFADARRVYVDSSPVKNLKVYVDSTAFYTRGDKCWPDWSNYMNPIAPDPPKQPYYTAAMQQAAETGVLTKELYCTQIPLCNGHLDLEPATTHVFAAPPAQTDAMGAIWVFDHWQFGNDTKGGQNTSVTIPADWAAHTFTAHFVKGVRASFVTAPVGLKIKIDGRDNWPAYNFEWGVGHKHMVSAPPEQTDSKGRRYRFAGWSNEGPAEQEITVTEDSAAPGGFRMVARYELLGQLSLRSEPSSLSFSVSGIECRTPCTIDRPEGDEVVIRALPDATLSPDTKALFTGWTDGVAGEERPFKFTTAAAAFTAKYRYLNRLTLIADPEEGATWQMEPAPELGNYFAPGTRLTLTAEPARGFKFRKFEGALSGGYNTGWLTLNAPATVVARLDRVPALDENSVRNAAGETPDQVVAPGSIVSIRGFNLAPGYEYGPENPLTQTLQGVVVLIDGRMLPLVSVSPSEILAQLPSDLPPGDYTLSIRQAGQPTLTAKFTTARNAPGLFRLSDAPPETPLALAQHADGSLVNAENPARTGETITLLGTGCGPAEPAPLDGFATPQQPPAPLLDPVELTVNGEIRPIAWTGSTPGRVGYCSVQFKIDPTMGSAQNLDVRIKAGGRVSNAVLLPVE